MTLLTRARKLDRRRVFLDLDGVLADFDSGYHQRFGVRPSIAADNVDWNLIRETPNFYRDLPPMPDAIDLYEGVCWLAGEPTILTGVPSSVPEAPENKRAWVRKHLGGNVPVIACLSKEKFKHGRPGDVLIDDWEKYRHLWEGMGGKWITHTSAKSSLDALSSLKEQEA